MIAVSDRLRTCINLCEIGILLFEQGKDNLLPTAIEALLETVQNIVEDYCVDVSSESQG